MLSPFMKLAHDDDVGVAIRKIAPGTVVGDLTVRDEVPMGRATRDIAQGELVHTHNLASD